MHLYLSFFLPFFNDRMKWTKTSSTFFGVDFSVQVRHSEFVTRHKADVSFFRPSKREAQVEKVSIFAIAGEARATKVKSTHFGERVGSVFRGALTIFRTSLGEAANSYVSVCVWNFEHTHSHSVGSIDSFIQHPHTHDVKKRHKNNRSEKKCSRCVKSRSRRRLYNGRGTKGKIRVSFWVNMALEKYWQSVGRIAEICLNLESRLKSRSLKSEAAISFRLFQGSRSKNFYWKRKNFLIFRFFLL